MDDFSKYERLRDSGADPRQVHEAGKADGLDSITLIRLVRKVFNLSLAEAKKAIRVGEGFDTKPTIRAGSTVHWEGFDPEDGIYFMLASVASVEGETAHLEHLKKYRMKDGRLTEVSIDGPDRRKMAVSHLERPLTDRLAEALRFFDELAVIDR